MKLKLGVKIEHLSMQLVRVLPDIREIYNAEDSHLVITSGHEGYPGDGVHGGNSKHYVRDNKEGNAIDTRIRHLTQGVALRIYRTIKSKLGKDFDVVFEGNHIHIELDPKGTT